MRFVCESCRAQYMINDDKVGPKGVKVRCRKCGYVITVKRTDAGAARPSANGQGGGASSSDAEDGLATQVMQTPLGAGADATLEQESPGDLTSPGVNTTPSPNSNASSPSMNAVDDDPIGKNFLGADDDEIGAVFDQVLKTGPVVKERLDEALGQRSEDDRQSTRVIDAQTVAALAKESETSDSKLDPVPDGNWFVAINEKQTGPLSLDKLKENWDRGEIGPDSLCWREGFSDWIPLSEVKALAVILAPKPPKPIVVPTATIPTSAPAVMSVPVQSAFSAGGLMQTVQSEVQVPISAAPSSSISEREESGTWKPSAASALASLVKDEMEALAKPPPKPVAAPVDDVPTRGLLDLPGNEEKAAAAAVAPVRAAPEPTRPPTNPYLANPGATYSAPAITQYRPQSNRGLIIGLSAGAAVIVLMLIGLIIWIVNRQPVAVAAVAPVAVAPVAAPTPTPVPAPAPSTPVAATAPTPAPAVPVPAVPVAAAPGVAAAQPSVPAAVPAAVPALVPAVAAKETPKEPVRVAAAAPVRNANPVRTEKAARPERPDPPPAPEPKETKKAASSGDGDDFESAFGPGKSTSATKKEEKKEAPTASRKGGYIPEAPGSGGDVKDSLGTSDILEVVSANKPALAKCAEEQRKRDPSTSGKLVMRWTIQTSGKVSRVDVVSEEFKGTYMAGCVGGLIKAMVFPRHKTQGEPVTFPFKF